MTTMYDDDGNLVEGYIPTDIVDQVKAPLLKRINVLENVVRELPCTDTYGICGMPGAGQCPCCAARAFVFGDGED